MKNIVYKNQFSFYLLISSIVVLLTLPILLQDGMFMDGEQYACVSRNLANRKGSFWFPFLSETWFIEGSFNFMEQPPLFYGLQSLFFRLFGDGIYTERLYSIFMLLLNCLSIHFIWNLIVDEAYKKLSWLPVLFWIITPVCFWSVQNNIIELTLSFFTLSAFYFILKGLLSSKKSILYLVFGGIFIFFATLTKGLQGLFPLVIVGFYYFSKGNLSLRKAIYYSFVILLIPCLIYLVLIWFNNEAKNSLSFYFYQRLLNRIENTQNTDNRYNLLWLLFQELLVMLSFTLLILIISIKNKTHYKTNKDYLLYIFIGLSASLPLMATLVQKNFYFLASIPFFAIGFSLLCMERVLLFIGWLNTKKKASTFFYIFTISLLFGSILFSVSQIGKISRDKEMIQDVMVLGRYLQKEKSVDTDLDIYETWNFQFYLLRKYDISIEPVMYRRKYYISDKNFYACKYFGYQAVPLNTKKYKLFRNLNY